MRLQVSLELEGLHERNNFDHYFVTRPYATAPGEANLVDIFTITKMLIYHGYKNKNVIFFFAFVTF